MTKRKPGPDTPQQQSEEKDSAIKPRGRPRVGRKLNVHLPEELIEKLEKAGAKRGLGYQTMIRLICAEKIDEYL